MFGKIIRGWWKPKYPNARWIAEAREETYNTPDILDLEQHKLQLLFLPCELQTGHPERCLAEEGGVRLFSAFSLDNFDLYRCRANHRAILLQGDKHRVKGEVWAINPSYISVLDNYKFNGVQCDRKNIDVIVPYSTETKTDVATEVCNNRFCKLRMWAYEGIPEFWSKELDAGFNYPTVTLYRPRNPFMKTFYFYHQNDRTK